MWYTNPVSNDSLILERAKEDINMTFMDDECNIFSPKYAVIATWDHVGYFKEQNDKVSLSILHLDSESNNSYSTEKHFPMCPCY